MFGMASQQTAASIAEQLVGSSAPPGLTMQEGDQPRMEWGGGRSKDVAASGAARRNYCYQPAPAASAPTVPSYVRLENVKLDESEFARMEAKKNTQQKRLTSQNLYAKRAARPEHRGTPEQGQWRWDLAKTNRAEKDDGFNRSTRRICAISRVTELPRCARCGIEFVHPTSTALRPCLRYGTIVTQWCSTQHNCASHVASLAAPTCSR